MFAFPRRLTALVLILCLAACATNPVTGKRELMLMTEGQEMQLGAESDGAIVGQYGLVDDPALAGYVANIGEQLVPVSHRPDLDFQFRLLDDPVVNAFALPGGYIYITRGILAYLNDEAALAGVMGHEVGHVTARHSAQRYTQQTLLGVGLGLGAQLSQTVARFAGVAGTAGQLLLLKYGRDDERQSDALGVEYATKIGYDTAGMAEFFNTLDRLHGDGPGLPSWASTHPDPGERYQTVLGLTAQWQRQVPGSNFRADRNGFVGRLEGLVYGANPRHGFVEGGWFNHPDLAFRFPVPEGWQLMNSSSQVQMGSPEGDAAVLFSIDASGSASAAAAIDKFVAETQMVVIQRSSPSIGGVTAARVEGSIASQDGELGVVSTFVPRDGRIYVFHGLCAAANLAGLRAGLVAVPDGFGVLSDPALLNKQPVVLKIVDAPRTASFRQLAAEHPIPSGVEIDLAGLALLNGVGLDTQIGKGAKLKLLTRRAS